MSTAGHLLIRIRHATSRRAVSSAVHDFVPRIAPKWASPAHSHPLAHSTWLGAVRPLSSSLPEPEDEGPELPPLPPAPGQVGPPRYSGKGRVPGSGTPKLTVSGSQVTFGQDQGDAGPPSTGKAAVPREPQKVKLREMDWSGIDFSALGVGGLDAELGDIFRRAFASRVVPLDVASQMGLKHVKGMLLYGPPGTGKTLVARTLGKLLSHVEPKVVNGPEIFHKWVGQSEENIRNLFSDAERDLKLNGPNAELHVIILDEIDALCKSRGREGGGSSTVGDNVVNQLLTKVDGVHALDNILVIGVTNRRDLLDEALLRPGRLEVQVEVGLPDRAGRRQILDIHTAKMRADDFLGAEVDLDVVAAETRNYSGAELEAVVKSAASFALHRVMNPNHHDDHPSRHGRHGRGLGLAYDRIKVSATDFDRAMGEVEPALGAPVESLERLRKFGMIPWGPRYTQLVQTGRALIHQVRDSASTSLLTCLLEGPSGSGKTALAASLALESSFPFVRVFGPESTVGLSEAEVCDRLKRVFDDARKSSLSVVVLDDIERLLGFVSVGPRFSNAVLQTLLVLLKQEPPEGHRLLVLGTTSVREVMSYMEVGSAFNLTLHVPALAPDDARAVLERLGCFSAEDVGPAVDAIGGEVPIKHLHMLLEMAMHKSRAAAALSAAGGSGARGGGGEDMREGGLGMPMWDGGEEASLGGVARDTLAGEVIPIREFEDCLEELRASGGPGGGKGDGGGKGGTGVVQQPQLSGGAGPGGGRGP